MNPNSPQPPNNGPKLDDDQVKAYEAIFNMGMKFILMVAGLVAFFWVLNVAIHEKDNISKGLYAVFDLMLGGTIYKVYDHYFSSSTISKKKR